MSNTLSIAAVTAALRNRLGVALAVDSAVSGTNITTLPLDQALDQVTGGGNQLNLFLYHVVPSAAFRNRGSPQPSRAGDMDHPPLSLTLHYLLSAYGDAGDDVLAHRIIGAVMASFHDQPLLTTAELNAALAGSDIASQVERVRITEQPLTTEEMYKLWSAFQTHYRVSAAYEVSVVMIDSRHPIRVPLPALRVNAPGDAQPSVDLVPPYPSLTAAAPPSPRDHALIGDTLTLRGNHLTDVAGSTFTAKLSHPLRASPAALSGAENQGAVTVSLTEPLPGDSAGLPAGIYTVSLEIQPPTPPGQPTPKVIATNDLPLVLAPKITAVPSGPVSRVGGVATLPISVSPQIRPGQRVFLLVGTQGFAAPIISAPAGDVTFTAAVAAGDYYLRIRVDGVDSQVIDFTASPLAFDPAVKVTIT